MFEGKIRDLRVKRFLIGRINDVKSSPNPLLFTKFHILFMKKELLAKITEKIFFPTNILVILFLFIILVLGKDEILLNDIIVFISSLLFFMFVSSLIKKRNVDENLLYFLSITTSLVFLILLTFFIPVSRRFVFATLCTTIVTFVILPLRVMWKISLHALAFTMMITVLTIFDLRFFVLFLFLPFIGWSRIKLKRHDSLQVITGTYVGFLIPTIIYGSYLLVKFMIKLYHLYFM